LEKRVAHLLEHDVVVRFISAEPLLGPLDLRRWLAAPGSRKAGINWVIAGGESGPDSRSMNPSWPEDIRDQCRIAKVPFHFKQWGHWAPEELIAEGISARAQRIEVVGRDGELIRLVKVGKAKGGRKLGGTTWDQVPQLAL
jgi:protein gp37